MKRYFVVLLTLCIAATIFAGGGSQSSGSGTSGYPNRPIEILVPVEAGTGTDLTLRAISPTMEKYLGVPILVINEPAANGEVATIRLAKNVRPDGYTWSFWNLPGLAMRCAVGNLKGIVDPVTDFVYGGGTYIDPNVIITQKNGPYKTLDDLVNAAKARPRTISWGRQGPISNDGMYIKFLEGYGATFNPIDGSNEIVSIMGGHLDVLSDNVSSSLQAYLDGAFEIIGVGSDQRVPEMPNVATFKEQGYDFPIQSSERHFWGPAGMDKAVADIFRAAVKNAVADPEYIERCKQLNLNPWHADADVSLRNVQRYVETWKSLE